MAEFTYNNAINASIGHASFKLNCGYHLSVSYEDEANFLSKFYSIDKLAKELKNLMLIC